MPNRIIKESICASENINDLTPEEEVFFYRLIVNCDDFGLMDARPQILRAKCFPLRVDQIKIKDIEKWLESLTKAGLIFLYEVDGKRYLKMTSWEKHQQRRANNSKYPKPDSDNAIMISDDINCNQMISDDAYNRESNSRIEYENTNTHKPEKIKFADFVSLTNAEYEALVAKLGEEGTKRCIEILDNYKGSTGKKYKSDYRTILNWVVQRYEEELQKSKGKTGNKAEFKPKEIYL